ncbi:MAG: GIY-YIG nuclease family protein [bacterium]|nr:GIY-YIG nuclease family protein [bacterium]
MHYFYILKSKRDKKLYLGFTGDLRKRFAEHQRGLVPSTKPRRPFTLAYYEAYGDQDDAARREKQMKRNGKAWGQLKRRIRSSIVRA